MFYSQRLLGALFTAVLCGAARADFQFTTFNSPAGLNLYGAAAVTGGALRLTPSQFNVAGAAYYGVKQNLAPGFTTTFTFRLTNPVYGSADGFAFVIHNSQVNLGGTGCRLGYDGINNSLAVEFDTQYNGSCQAGNTSDPNDNHISIHTMGVFPNSSLESASIGRTTAIPLLRDGLVHTVTIEYDLQVLRVFIDSVGGPPVLEVPVDLGTTLALDKGTAFVGFTAATGGFAQTHSILSWSLTSNPNPTGKHRPATPTIREPSYEGVVRSPSDIHMETAPMVDADRDNHACSDWEIWTVSPPQLVWRTSCITGPEKLHTHLGDGVFEGPYAGRRDLMYDTDYSMRVRHRDDGADPDRQWSFYATRRFRTGSAGTIFPLLMDDISGAPLPTWTDVSGRAVKLPGGATPARLVADSADAQLLLEIRGSDGTSNITTNPDALAGHVAVRLHLHAGSAPVNIAESTLTVLHDCRRVSIYLPPVALAAGASSYLWAAEDGATYRGSASDTQPQFSTLAQYSPIPWTVAQEGYVLERFAGGFQLPVNIAFIPNPGPAADAPFFYVTELYGTVKLVTRSGVVSDYATGLLNFDPTGNFPGSGEEGVSGIVVDPATGDVFVALLYEGWTPNGSHFPKVIRLKSTNGGRTASSQTTVIDMWGEYMGQSHFISNLSIGPDGKLYVHVGDGLDATKGQDMTAFRGKILRVNLDGSAPADNPFYDAADGFSPRDYIFAPGLRNPFGGCWRLSDASHYCVENGPSVDRFARIVRGRNYLWDGSDASMINYAIYNWYPAHAPVNIAVIEPGVFGGSGFPASAMNHFFVTESGPTWGTGPQELGKRIVEFNVDSAGNLVGGPTTLVEYAGSGKGTAVALAAGPDGLYFSDLYKDQLYSTAIDRGSNIFRIRYQPANDCNHNGTDDACDIASGTSFDRDFDGVPDECECVADFNTDGFVDAIDYDLFNNAFESGDPESDINRDGFVDGMDYDQFMNAFEHGC